MAFTADEVAETRALPRTLAGATVLQIIPALHDNAIGRATIAIAQELIRAGARSIVAAERGALVEELGSFGGEWLPFASSTLHPWRMHGNAQRLAPFLAEQGVDVVHAKSVGAAWTAWRAIRGSTTRLVTELPDLPRSQGWVGRLYFGAVSRGHRIICRSQFEALPMIRRYDVPSERVSVIPRVINSDVFNPMAVEPSRVAALRQAWGIPMRARVVLVPGRLAPWNGQIHLVEAARLLLEKPHSLTYVLAGDDRRHPRYARKIMTEAQAAGVDALFRVVGHVADMPAAYAAADVVVVPAVVAPVYGRVVAEAQAMARPVITTAVGALPENLIAPPRMPAELRTGWVVEPANPAELAHALDEALSLDAAGYRALAGRVRQYGEFSFTPQRAAAATVAVYSSLLSAAAADTEPAEPVPAPNP